MKVFIIAAISIDGFIARNDNEFPNWTSPEDLQFFVAKTKEAGTLVMGANTYQTLLDKGRKLPGRRNIIYTSNLTRFDTNTETTALSPSQLIEQLSREGVETLAVCGGSTIYGLFLDSGVVSEMYITVEPVVFGEGIKLFNQKLIKHFSLEQVTKLNADSLLLHYVAKPS